MSSKAYAAYQDSRSRTIGVSLVALLHVILIWGLIDGLGHKMIDVVKGPIVAHIVPPPQVKKETPPPPPPQIVTPPPPYIPPPVVNVDAPASPNAITSVSTAPPPSAAPAPVQAAPAPLAVPDRDVSEVPIGGAAPVYPESMQEQQREGWATVACVVDVSGQTSDCQLLETHGGHAFGDSALSFAQSQRYRPAVHDGQPITKRRVWRLSFTLS